MQKQANILPNIGGADPEAVIHFVADKLDHNVRALAHDIGIIATVIHRGSKGKLGNVQGLVCRLAKPINVIKATRDWCSCPRTK